MTPFQEFQREVNFLKNIYFFIIFVVLILYIFFKIIIPDIGKYKEINIQIQKDKSRFNLIEEEFNRLQDLHNKKLQANKYTLNTIVKIYSELSMSQLLDKYFTSFELTQKESMRKKDHTITIVEAKAKTTNPQNFYLFIQSLQKVGNLVEVSYPLDFESKDGYLNVSFTLKVYAFD